MSHQRRAREYQKGMLVGDIPQVNDGNTADATCRVVLPADESLLQSSSKL